MAGLPGAAAGQHKKFDGLWRGDVLRKYQWDLIHDPVGMIPWFQDEGEARNEEIVGIDMVPTGPFPQDIINEYSAKLWDIYNDCSNLKINFIEGDWQGTEATSVKEGVSFEKYCIVRQSYLNQFDIVMLFSRYKVKVYAHKEENIELAMKLEEMFYSVIDNNSAPYDGTLRKCIIDNWLEVLTDHCGMEPFTKNSNCTTTPPPCNRPSKAPWQQRPHS